MKGVGRRRPILTSRTSARPRSRTERRTSPRIWGRDRAGSRDGRPTSVLHRPDSRRHESSGAPSDRPNASQRDLHVHARTARHPRPASPRRTALGHVDPPPTGRQRHRALASPTPESRTPGHRTTRADLASPPPLRRSPRAVARRGGAPHSGVIPPRSTGSTKASPSPPPDPEAAGRHGRATRRRSFGSRRLRPSSRPSDGASSRGWSSCPRPSAVRLHEHSRCRGVGDEHHQRHG